MSEETFTIPVTLKATKATIFSCLQDTETELNKAQEEIVKLKSLLTAENELIGDLTKQTWALTTEIKGHLTMLEAVADERNHLKAIVEVIITIIDKRLFIGPVKLAKIRKAIGL
jgi:hypothetical protein